MPGFRTDCCYCKESVLSNNLGLHIIRKHEKELFSEKDNLASLHKDKYLKEPLILTLDVTPYHFCLGDNSCIRKSITAMEHFKGKKDAHCDALLKLREKYPLDGSVKPDVEPPPAILNKKEVKFLQVEIVELISALRKAEKMAHIDDNNSFFFSKKSIALYQKIGLVVDEEELRALYPSVFEIEEVVEEEEEEQHEEPIEEPPPPLEPQEEEEEQQTIEVLDKKIETYTPPPPHHTPTLPKPRQDIFLPQPSRQPSYPTVKIIQSTKR